MDRQSKDAEKLDMICGKVADCYRRIYGDAVKGIYLYGSYARGDYDEESDIDFAAIVDGERLELQGKMYQLWDASAELDLAYDVVISATVIPFSEYTKYKPHLRYYQNIEKEGRRIA